ncbi:hypothetical protein SKAU_G00411190 [Synaphobranchus kaupii]|uniref:Uncharacterized protein n=1 Tax=Synaphobranchus kaupii TaxID=118154 RepID=A0A9Q1E7S9_SYNKA|nr:hypothetical protein SKAU_G00411190 [Synaphobranchus kaupii]
MSDVYELNPPVLPVGQFSEKFIHFITQCMKKLPKERPAPNNLMVPLCNSGLGSLHSTQTTEKTTPRKLSSTPFKEVTGQSQTG